MLTYQPVRSEREYEELLELIYHQKDSYLEPKLDLIQMTCEQFGNFFKTKGSVFCIRKDGELAGFYWIEEHGDLLELRGLVLKDHYQGQGIGTWVLRILESTCPEHIQTIELLVHQSNPRAKALYERMGYVTASYAKSKGFYTMRKHLSRQPEPTFQDWLMQSRVPSIRWQTLRDLHSLPEADPRLAEARQEMHQSGPLPAILASQTPAGNWSGERSYYWPKYTSTHWSLLLLAELGASPAHPGLQRGVEYMLAATEKELLEAGAAHEHGLACFWANLLRYALHCGRGADRRAGRIVDFLVEEALEGVWRCEHNGGLPCAWGAARSLWALAALDARRRSPQVERAICSALQFLLEEHHLEQADYPASQGVDPLWFQLNFPLFYQVDILFVLRALADLGALGHPGARPALEWLAAQRGPEGRWRGESPFRELTWPFLGDAQEIDRWVSLQAQLVLRSARLETSRSTRRKSLTGQEL